MITPRPLEYNSWHHMKDRCENPNCKDYKYYGGRGISVCEEWSKSFSAFMNDMGKKPNKGDSIDRIDPDGNYCKENCRWADRKTQNVNKKTTHRVTVYGEVLTLQEISERYGVKYKTVQKRHWEGIRDERLTMQRIASKDYVKKTIKKAA